MLAKKLELPIVVTIGVSQKELVLQSPFLQRKLFKLVLTMQRM
jgi:hypothetical protein